MGAFDPSSLRLDPDRMFSVAGFQLYIHFVSQISTFNTSFMAETILVVFICVDFGAVRLSDDLMSRICKVLETGLPANHGNLTSH